MPAQTHSTLEDPWREQEEIDLAVRDVEAGGGTIEVFDYPGSGHLFTDPTLPAEYDADSHRAFLEPGAAVRPSLRLGTHTTYARTVKEIPQGDRRALSDDGRGLPHQARASGSLSSCAPRPSSADTCRPGPLNRSLT